MTHHGTKQLSRIKNYLARLLERADRAICAEPDERARKRGWTVTRTGFGARSYRDPRFDRLRGAGGPGALPEDGPRAVRARPPAGRDDLLYATSRRAVPTGRERS
ncbi:hypothetical protein Ssi03_64240 [Sphaerisporangium siamense]|uniref:Uncharacterized protein n=1 Tax=Sphaerisporangium siamense TaxID=795645 RepID=A0A7W7G7E3_9ACTN|nr:hypothetical protein [Sphaerisporangium siamense]MBB4699037.1 hypothetical protein [Sphaerisporangium siamense]GII88434.1 hypothetical protein Ssi03_64240 [Sphaerisporangium siamense]